MLTRQPVRPKCTSCNISFAKPNGVSKHGFQKWHKYCVDCAKAIYNKKISRQETLKDNKYVSLTKGDGGNIIFKSGGLTYDRDNEHHIEDILCKIRTLETAAMYIPLTHKTIKKQQFQQALLYNLSTPCFDFDRFLKN